MIIFFIASILADFGRKGKLNFFPF